MATCARCGVELTGRQAKRRYCSAACYHASSVGHEPYNQKPATVKQCRKCGKEFETGGRGRPRRAQEFCSMECAGRVRFKRAEEANALRDVDAAYLAAFIDGEGCIILARRTYGLSMRLHATNTDTSVLEWIAEITGTGQVLRQSRGNEKHNASYHWQVHGLAAASVLRQILPYIRIKRAQAELAIAAQGRMHRGRRRSQEDRDREQSDIEQMHRLNKRGPRGNP